MADPVINSSTRKKSNPTLADLLNLYKKQVFLELNCHAIGTVQSFNPVNQTLVAKINYKKSVIRPQANGVYETVLLDYPALIDVPAIVLGGGLAGVSFPIQAGDQCLILFNDRDIDNWFQSGQLTALSSTRLHSFTDGIALVGLHSMANPIPDYDTSRASLYNGTTRVAVGADKVLVENATYTLNELLQNLLTQLTMLTTALSLLTVTGVTTGGGTSGVPANAVAIAAIGTNISSIATQLGSLLE